MNRGLFFRGELTAKISSMRCKILGCDNFLQQEVVQIYILNVVLNLVVWACLSFNILLVCLPDLDWDVMM